MEVTGITVEKALEIQNATVVSGYIAEGSGHLILVTAGGLEIDAGEARQTLFDLTDIVLTGTLAEFNTALEGANFASLAGVETLTNKSIDLTDNTLQGSRAEFNAAMTDDDFATLAGAETLTNKTLTSPIINGINKVTYVEKTADESVNSTNTGATLQADNHLTVPIPEVGTYLVDYYLFCTSAVDDAGDIKFAWTFPTGTLRMSMRGLSTAVTSGVIGDTVNAATLAAVSGVLPSSFFSSGLSTDPTMVWMHGKLDATATGDLALMWAQLAAHASNTTVRTGSHLMLRRVA